ncbi:ABC transporter ATP-binding protein [uncultured Sneathia sp.]|uniref:ABC transporter ATP-binding protein n=1 Tax=uncultured Sneathia sp. TaxID=278067 RepID=UPI00259ADBA0|nr:ABC transporter ATP-binding protein [uncultured Sneathia sp.]
MLSIKNLIKKYKNKSVLKNLNLELNSGEILGLLGPNGCGKTTLMKILSTTNSYNSGEIVINGEKLGYITNKYVAFLPDTPFIDKNDTIKNAIDEYSYFFDDFDNTKADILLQKLNLNKNQKISTLSKGMVEKLQLILILSRNAKLYILDEPIAGVDIVTRKEIMKLITENINQDSSVIITTHLISDIEQLFDKVAFLKDGKIDKIHDVETIRYETKKSVEQLYIECFGGNIND